MLCKTGFLQKELDDLLIPENEVIQILAQGVDIGEYGLLVLCHWQDVVHALHSNIGSLNGFIQMSEHFCEKSGPQ